PAPANAVYGSVSDGSMCQMRLNSHGCCYPSYNLCVPTSPSYTNMLLSPLGIPSAVIKSSGFVPGGFHVLPPSSERWMICPNQPLVCDAKMRFGSAGDPLRWYISQPAKCGPLTSQFWRLPSAVRMNAPFFVPTSNRILLMLSVSFMVFFHSMIRRTSERIQDTRGNINRRSPRSAP